MTSTFTVIARFAGLFLCLLSLFVLTGWLTGSEVMVRVIPGSVAMSINAALLFLVAGACLFAGAPVGAHGVPIEAGEAGAISTGGATSRRVYHIGTGILIILPLAILAEHVFDLDLGVDLANLHASLGDGHSRPGRTAPNTCIGFLFAGLAFLIHGRAVIGPRLRLAGLGLALATIGIGTMGLLGYVLNLEAMYKVAAYNTMATLSAMGTIALGIGLWSVANLRRQRERPVHGEAMQITRLTASLLTVFAVTAGLAGFGILRAVFEQSAADNLQASARTHAFSISLALDHVALLAESVATRPSVREVFAESASDSRDPRSAERLQATAQSMLDLGFSSVVLFGADGATLAMAGNAVGERATHRMPLGRPEKRPEKRTEKRTEKRMELLWRDGLVFRSDHAIVQEGRTIGRMVLERHLTAISSYLSEIQKVAQTTDVILCSRLEADAACFPSRFYKDGARSPMFGADGKPALLVSRALLGESGSAATRDLRGTNVLAGYAPIEKYGLATLIKQDVTEVYTGLRERLHLLLVVLVAFIAVGGMLVRKMVMPLIERIESEQQRVKAILGNSNDAFVAVGRDGRITDWNAQAEKTFGWPASEAIGRELADLIVPEDHRHAGAMEGGFHHLFQTGASPAPNRRVEVTARRRDGHEFPIELSVAPFHDGWGFAAGAFLRDLSEQKETERKAAEDAHALEETRGALLQSQKLEAVGKLTGGVAHDFNNVLQVVKGSLQLLQAENAHSYQVEKRVMTAMSAVDRGARLSTQLLAFARRQPLAPRAVNLGRVVRGMGELLQRALGETVEIEVVAAAGLWNTFVDTNQLENVILNLAINARDAMKGTGRLTIEVGNAMLDEQYARIEPGLKAGQYVMVAISDTGPGMPPEVRERAFEPFFTTKPEGEGTGLGLSMAYGFVKQSEGHIRIYSELGHGTTIRIYLPRCHEGEIRDDMAYLPGDAAGTAPGGNETVLVVEDDPSVRATVVDLLSGLGYRVLQADHAQAALDLLEKRAAQSEELHLLFTDVVMPGTLRSPELARRAAAIFPGIRVLFTSGYTQNAIVHGGRLDPGVHLLSKPYGREQLARKIREVLGDGEGRIAATPASSVLQEAAPAGSAAEAAPAASAAPPESMPVTGGALDILFVDDNDDFRMLTSEMLAMLGHRVESCASAEAAAQRLRTQAYDVLLTDVSLPGMSGVELAAGAVASHPRMRIILASGYGKSVSEGLQFPFRVLPKPFTISELREALESGEEAMAG